MRIHVPPILALAFVSALPAAQAAICAVPAISGRWQGVVDVPGEPVPLVVDLAPDPKVAWVGSAVLPGRGIKGAALDALGVSCAEVRFGLASAFPQAPAEGAPQVVLGVRPDGSLAGTWTIGSLSAPVTLHRTGEAQVDRPPVGTPISGALAGTWRGRYELGGVPREVTLTLANRDAQGATGRLVIVGKQTTTLDVDFVSQGREFVTLRAGAADFRIEGRFAAAEGTIEGSMSQGPFDAPLVLRREKSS
jgi:hypothetical protein